MPACTGVVRSTFPRPRHARRASRRVVTFVLEVLRPFLVVFLYHYGGITAHVFRGSKKPLDNVMFSLSKFRILPAATHTQRELAGSSGSHEGGEHGSLSNCRERAIRTWETGKNDWRRENLEYARAGLCKRPG